MKNSNSQGKHELLLNFNKCIINKWGKSDKVKKANFK